MSQAGQPAMEQQIARGVNHLNGEVEKLAEAVQRMVMKDDERQMFSQQIAAVEEEIRNLRNNNGTRERHYKPRQIKPYDGESQTLQSFLTAIELQMENDGVTDNEKKVKYVGNYFIGKAWYWFEPIMRERNAKKKEDWSDRTKKILSSFKEMKRAMQQVFGDLDEKAVAAQKLQSLRQHRSVKEYITDFQTISSNLEWDEEALMDKFKGGLKSNILSLLIFFPEEPEDLEELFERAQKIDREAINQRSRETYNNRTFSNYNTSRKKGPYEERVFSKNRETNRYPRKDRDGDIQMTGAKVDLEKARTRKAMF
jgi:hypothetical protein